MDNGKLKKKAETVLRQVDDDFIIVPIKGKLAKDGALFQLNKTAADVWSFINSNETEVDFQLILEHISSLYQIDSVLISDDIHDIIDVFLNNELLEHA